MTTNSQHCVTSRAGCGGEQSPEPVRLFNTHETQPAKNHRKTEAAQNAHGCAPRSRGCATSLGPRILNEAEVRTQKRAPLPRTAPPDTATAVARRSDPVPGLALTRPVAVVYMSLAPSAIAATPHGIAEEEPAASMERARESLSREALTFNK